ncbi:MAG: class I SAM-dependent methyltransferase [Chloroflexota bacterium]|nr:class I SAM-dependent methyltransferase [Chloroflexota bacterium]
MNEENETRGTSTRPRRERRAGFSSEQELYQPYSVEEDRERTNTHYEQPVEFFYALTGGEWNVYSANLWSAAQTQTESQEKKLDLLAELMHLRPGMRILDVGCGWGGPLAYLSKKYGVRGVGLTLSSLQKGAADERIAAHGADVTIVESHWKDYVDIEPFDGVYTDEVIVHFHDLGDFFANVYGLLRPGGVMLNKELHLVHARHSEMTRAMSFINEVFGSTGNYRTLAEELTLVGEAGFDVEAIRQMPLREYQKTVDSWLANMKGQRPRLEELVGRETFRRFQTYLQLCHYIQAGRA